MFTLTWLAATAVASASATRFVIAKAIPVPYLIPIVPNGTVTTPEAGTGIVIAIAEVPTVGAVAKLYSFTKAAAAPAFEHVIE